MRLIGLLLMLLVGFGVSAQDVSFKASAPSVVELGEHFRLAYSVNKRGNDPQIPTFEGFDLLMGPSTSSSSSFSMVNGQVTQSQAFTYTYVLQGVKEGVYQIPPATITIDGKQYKSNALKIEVVKGSGNQGGGQAARQGNHLPQSGTSGEVNDENLFLKVDVNRKSLYIGENLVATIKVYSRVDLANLERPKFPAFDGFLAEEIPTPERIELTRETYDGKVYQVGIIRKMLLFPQHAGEITIEPFELECIVRERVTGSRSFFDDFFQNYRDVSVKRKSRPVRIDVKELPSEDKPLGFSGMVGNVVMATSLSTDTVKANEAITYKVTVKGTGNLKLLPAPSISFPHDFEVYDPKINKDIKTTATGMSGTVTFEYLLLPRYAGEYKIPAVQLSYFDPSTGSYKMLGGKEYDIHVLKGAEKAGEGSDNVVRSFKKEDVKFLGEDIRYLKSGNLNLHAKGVQFFMTPLYLAAFLIPFILFIIGALLNRRRIKANADLVRVKNKTANKMAGKRMKLAASAMKGGNTELFYDEVLKALWGYVSYKLNIDKSELNRDNITDILTRKGVEVALQHEFMNILDECEFARYAPGINPTEKMDHVYREGISVITKLDKVIK